MFAYNSGPDNGISDVSLVSVRKQQSSSSPPQAQQQQQAMPKEPQINIDSNTQKPLVETVTREENSTETVKSPQTPNEIQNQTMSEPAITTNSKQVGGPERNLYTECCDSFVKSNIYKWNLFHHRAYGIACSLYENNPVTNSTVGDPIADTYAILARKNSAMLILGDGVNWGPRSRVASRAAVRASMNFINRHLFFAPSSQIDNQLSLRHKSLTTHDLFKVICRSFDAAQEFILQKKGTMTTLCCSVVVKLKESSSQAWVS